MIHVPPQPAPSDFDASVKQPGQQFLATCPRPKTKDWKNHSYWTKVLHELHDRYNGICAYACHWIPCDTGADTVEHFLPKGTHPNKAYEWDNYRLVCQTLNGRKGTQADVLDPFLISDGWFILDFPSLLVKPLDGLPDAISQKVLQTRDRLKLNDEGTCLKSRLKWVMDYCDGYYDLRHLERSAPFIYIELKRQGLEEKIKDIMLPR